MKTPVRVGRACLALAIAVTCNAWANEASSTDATAATADEAQTQDTGSATGAKKKPNVIDDGAQRLDEVTVTTGTRSAKAVDKIPGAVTVVTPIEVSRTLALTDDATAVLARTVPGYAESSQALSNTGENLRGRIALRLFDGIPQGSPLREGTRNATFTDMGVVDRIEVINGPSAAEGIGAAGGIINYISKTATEEGNHAELTTRYSTQGEDDSGGYKIGVNFAHKSNNFDMYLAGAQVDRGITWDGNGRRVGMNPSGSVADSKARNAFAKFGYNFGEGEAQRLQLTLSKFKIDGKDNYIEQLGDRALGITDTSVRGHNPGQLTPFNDFWQGQLSYSNANFFDGTLTLDAYRADQAMRYLPESGPDRQDPDIAPLGTLIDQSEIKSAKKGFRTSWTRPELFNVAGLELRTGIDLVQDTAQQRLAITNRVWVPPMKYDSVAPYLQLSWDVGPITLSGGLRREDGTLEVDDYTTTYFRNRVFVQGGKLDYQANLPNLGAIWRFNDEWSAFASWSKGFTLPNIGIPLRNVSTPGRSVEDIADLQAVIVKNTEVGVNWRGESLGFSASTYKSTSEFGSSLSIDPVTNDFVLTRAPVEIKGVEFSGDWRISDDFKATLLYSRIMGYSTFVAGGPLERHMGVNDINPDKLSASLTWRYSDRGDVTLDETTLRSRVLNPGTSAAESTKGYTLWNLTANYQTEKFGRLTVGVENLFDKFYILSWSQLPAFQNYFAGRGRVISITDQFTF